MHLVYIDKICVNDEHPLAGQDIQYRAPDSHQNVQHHWMILKYNVQTCQTNRLFGSNHYYNVFYQDETF